MLRDAARRVAQAADAIGIRGIVVHAISEDARRFYIALGFDPCPAEGMTLLATLGELRAALGQISVVVQFDRSTPRRAGRSLFEKIRQMIENKEYLPPGMASTFQTAVVGSN
jgi:hypothetical protein